MKLKRIAAMLTVAVMAVSLAACGGNADTNTESSQNLQLRHYLLSHQLL